MRPIELPPLPSQRAISASDLTGGLDFTPTGYGIASNRSSEALNVNWLANGGFELRKAVRPFSPTTLSSSVVALGYLESAAQQLVLVALSDGSVWACSGLDQPLTPIIGAGGPPFRSFYQVNDRVYMGNGVANTRAWDGVTVYEWAEGWNSSPVGSPTPTNDHMPRGRYIAVYGGHMHMAYTWETGTNYHPNRIRQSFAMVNRTGELDWRIDDYFDIDSGKDGQSIVGLLTVGQKLFCMRQHSLYQIEGSDYTEYAFPEVSSDRGASSERAFCSLDDQLWCWDSNYGLHVTSGYSDANGSIVREVVTGGLEPLLRAGEFINPDRVCVGTDGKLILVSTDTKTWGRRTFAYDPRLKSWTAWDLKLGPMVAYPGAQKTPYWLASTDGPTNVRVLRFGVKSSSDEMGSGEAPIPALVRTAWLDDSRPISRKLGRVVQYVYESGASATTEVTAYADWGARELFTSTLPGTAPTTIFSVGSSELLAPQQERRYPGAELTSVPCQVAPVGSPEVGPVDPPTSVLSQPLTTCSFRSVQLLFRCSAPSESWRVRAVSLLYQTDARRP